MSARRLHDKTLSADVEREFATFGARMLNKYQTLPVVFVIRPDPADDSGFLVNALVPAAVPAEILEGLLPVLEYHIAEAKTREGDPK